jgi:hypothetical protein
MPVVLIETTFGLAELQVTDEEISFFVPSSYMPVAENWPVKPIARVASGGLNEMEVS